MSRLAEVYDAQTRLSASDIAASRKLQGPFLAKVLSALSQAGIVNGSRGPGGGFMLARHPRDITLHDVFRLFERQETADACPFGGGLCGAGAPCPLHDRFAALRESMREVLDGTTFDAFRKG